MSLTNDNVFVYYWTSFHDTTPKNYSTNIRVYGINQQGLNVGITISKVKSKCYLEICDTEFLLSKFERIKQEIKEKILFCNDDVKNIKLVWKKKLYTPNVNVPKQENNLYPYIEFKTNSKISLYSLRKKIPIVLGNKDHKFHEIDVPLENQFMVEHNIYPSGWVKLSAVENILQEKTTNCKIEYEIFGSQIQPIHLNEMPNIKIISWDIEANCMDISDNPGKCAEDYVFQISCVGYSLQSKEWKKTLLTLGDCSEFANDVEIIKYKTEKDLIVGFCDYIKKEKPNILTGWNIMSFDIEYLINRANILMCTENLMNYGFSNDESKIVHINWSSKAFSSNIKKYIDSEGILSIDLIDVVRREYKLDSYKLDNVAKHFLGSQKDDVGLEDIQRAVKYYNNFQKESNLSNFETMKSQFTLIGKYCVQDSKLVIDLFLKLQTFLSFVEMSKTTCTQIMTIHLQGQQKKFYNQIYNYCSKNNIIVEDNAYKSKSTDNYVGAYVVDPYPGLYEYVIPLDFESLYPSIIIAYNLDYSTIVYDDTIDEENLHIIEWEDHIACEHDPLIKQKKSLSQMIDVCTDAYKKKQLREQRAEISKKINKRIICQKNKFKFLKSEVYGKGVVPTIIQNLLDARKKVRTEMKTEKDPEILALLNQRQLSYKISANSMYGAMGVKVGALPFMPVAMCVTAIGRQSNKKVSMLLKEKGWQVVYGDTDSNYVTIESEGNSIAEKCKSLWDKAEIVSKEISEHFRAPMKLAFEETIYYKFMILTKKRYMYYSCNKMGEVSKKIGQKGVLLARRDQCKFTKNIYEDTVMRVFNGESKEQVFSSIHEAILQLLTLNIDWNIMKINKSINNYNDCKIVFDEESNKYKMGAYTISKPQQDYNEEELKEYFISRLPAQVQLELKRLNRNEEKTEGCRMDYVVTKKPGKKQKQCDLIEEFSYFQKNKNILKLDNFYYIERLINPLEQIFKSVYKEDNYIYKNFQVYTHKVKIQEQLNDLFSPKIILD